MTREWIWVLLISILASCENGTHEDELKTQATPLFDLLPSQQSGIDFSNNLTENLIANILEYEYFYNGGGVAIGDIDGDGLPDIYITGNQVKNKLYHNKGNLTFEDITTTAGVEGKIGWTTGVTMADVNADGYLDIYVCKSGKYQPSGRKNELYINNGDLTFTESAAEFGLNDPGYSTQALFFDYDRDNDLDMFLLNHSIQLFTGRDALKLKKQIDPYAGDKLFRNENGTFIDVSEHAGIHQNPLGYGLGVAASDVNQDGWPDIYVTNDYVEPDYMYINNGDGTFSESIKEATYHISNFGMGVDIADINNDAWPDIYVADMVAEDNYRQKTNMGSMAPEKFYQAVKFGFHHQYMFNTLQLNRGNLHFSEIAQMAGISNTDWSWATLLADLNNDGLQDLLVTNGFRKEFSNKDFVNFRNEFIDSVRGYDKRTKLKAFNHLLEQIPETKLANYVFENQGDLSFSKRAENWGFSIPSHSNGASVADLDNDGDLDIVISNIDDTAFVYRNNTNLILKANYLRVKLKGPAGNTSGIGTKLYLKVGGQNLFREHFLSRGYQSSVEDIVHFGLGDHTKINRIQVIWPDGKSRNSKISRLIKL